jgi:elongation factor Ts
MITASLVKELREKTGAGMMDCKKALEESNGDMAKAVDWLREKGIAKAAKKAGRIAAEGLTKVVAVGDTAVVIEINSETDFVAKNEQFLSLINKVADTVLVEKPATLEAASALAVDGSTIEGLVTEATANIGEKISFRRFVLVEKTAAQTFGQYIHMGGKISALAVISGGSEEVAKDIAMQVASMAPSFVSRENMDETFIAHERQVQMGIAANDPALANKPEKILAGIIEGRLSKSLQEMCLVDQVFFKNPEIKVAQYLKEHNAECLSFVRYSVGEGIEKQESDFAAEVASMVSQ